MADAVPKEQSSFEETQIADDELESMLERREDIKARRSDANTEFAEADKDCKARLAQLEPADDAILRVGRFVIKPTHRDATTRSFEVKASDGFTIDAINA